MPREKRSHLGNGPVTVLFATSLEQSECLAKGPLPELERLLRTYIHFLLSFLLHPPGFASIFPSTTSHIPLSILSVAFTFPSSLCSTHLSLTVTHQECVSENMSERRLVTEVFIFLTLFCCIPLLPLLPPALPLCHSKQLIMPLSYSISLFFLS